MNKKIDIKGWIETSLLDWDGKIVTVLFVGDCNFSCPYCQNWTLIEESEKIPGIPFEKIKDFFVERREFIDGVCISGGEPTIYSDLPEFASKIKKLNFEVKLDTNGSMPDMLEKLIAKNLLDYVAMDIKAPFEKYPLLTGVKADIKKIKSSINVLMNSNIGYEFRTTVIPTMLSENDILEIAKAVKGAKKYVLQQFVPTNVRDEKLRKIPPYEPEVLEKIAAVARQYVSCVKVRA